MDLFAEIKGIKYNPFLYRDLGVYSISELKTAFSKDSVFILESNSSQFAISWWVSAKRTRSYPYARIYDSFGFSGKRITVIPVFKDEGKDGDRDYLQWDTISLMSLLGVYVIIAYYIEAERNSSYENKITKQRFDVDYIKKELNELSSYQSDALHWNLSQLDRIGDIGQKAITAYTMISKKLNIRMHSLEIAKKRVEKLLKGKESFITFSRNLAIRAQKRESVTIQPKEKISGIKGAITIKNYLGGYYYFTADEVEIDKNNIYLIEAKHSKTNSLPSLEDIKDGLLKMMLFCNLSDIKFGGRHYNSIAVLKLSVASGFDRKNLNEKQLKVISSLERESKVNNFELRLM